MIPNYNENYDRMCDICHKEVASVVLYDAGVRCDRHVCNYCFNNLAKVGISIVGKYLCDDPYVDGEPFIIPTRVQKDILKIWHQCKNNLSSRED